MATSGRHDAAGDTRASVTAWLVESPKMEPKSTLTPALPVRPPVPLRDVV